jgi:hypothetical protein
MAKIESLKPRFENMQALLARIAEDEEAEGFIGCVLRKDGTMVPVSFEATRDQMAFAAAIWLRDCVEAE